MDYSGSTCIDELNFLLNKTVMIRRLKKDVLTELPSKTRQKIPIKLNEDLRKKIVKKLESSFNKQKDIRSYVENKLQDMCFEEGIERGAGGQGDPDQKKTKSEEEYISFMEAYKLTG